VRRESEATNAGSDSHGAEQIAERTGALKGHDFSRAESGPDKSGALAPEGSFSGTSPKTTPSSAASDSGEGKKVINIRVIKDGAEARR
jgi:hypothetical protein